MQCSASCCSHSCTQQHRTQTARNIELLADASSIGTRWSSVCFSQKQNVFWRQGELFPRGTAEEPHAPDADAQASDSEPLADDHSSDSDDARTGVEESAAPAAPAVAAAPESSHESAGEAASNPYHVREHTTIMTALCLCVVRKMSSASLARACMSAFVASMSVHSTCTCVVSICLHVFRQFHRLRSE